MYFWIYNYNFLLHEWVRRYYNSDYVIWSLFYLSCIIVQKQNVITFSQRCSNFSLDNLYYRESTLTLPYCIHNFTTHMINFWKKAEENYVRMLIMIIITVIWNVNDKCYGFSTLKFNELTERGFRRICTIRFMFQNVNSI